MEKFLWTQRDGTDVNSEKYKAAVEISMSGPGGILREMDRYKLDVLATPANAEIPISFAAKLGLPIISVPLGFYPEGTEIKMNRRGNLIQFAPGIP